MNLNLRAPINNLSYGILSSYLLVELTKLGVKVALFPIGPLEVDSEEKAAVVRQSLENAKLFSYDAPSLTIFHQFSLAERVGRGMCYGFPIFELDTFNQVELHHLRGLDSIIVCSKWAKGICENSGLNGLEIDVVPLGVDTSVFYPLEKGVRRHRCAMQTLNPEGPFVFLNISKIEQRKGADLLCELFNRAFSPLDNVELWWASHNPFLPPEQTQEWHSYYLDSPMGKAGKIKIIPRVGTHKEVADLIRNSDCGIYPSRAEGFNFKCHRTFSVR
jgi:glycosyltransferase involved in cell wall biosynthesis